MKIDYREKLGTTKATVWYILRFNFFLIIKNSGNLQAKVYENIKKKRRN